MRSGENDQRLVRGLLPDLGSRRRVHRRRPRYLHLHSDRTSGVVLTDTRPKNAGFGSVTTSQGSCSLKPQKRLVTCALGSLASGAHATVTIVVKPTVKGKITNTATATSDEPDPNLANNTGTAVTKVMP